MVRFHAVASWFLNSLGVALLLLSLMVIPTYPALGQTYGQVCNGESCTTAGCTVYWVKYGECPNSCGFNDKYCYCTSDANNCGGCTCQKNPVQDACSCLGT